MDWNNVIMDKNYITDLKKNIENHLLTYPLVTRDDDCSGIYIIYLRGIKRNDMIPVYIGQSINMYNRKKHHFRETRKLLKYDKDSYNDLLKSCSGRFLYCKLAALIVNEHSSFDDLQIYVVEKCKIEDLNDREQYYIKKFECENLGFNQFDCIIKSNQINGRLLHNIENPPTEKESLNILEMMIDKICNINSSWFQYGYYEFNCCILINNLRSLSTLLPFFIMTKNNINK